MNHDVFISYSSRDKATALAICHVLEEHRIRCWIAPRDIPVGADYGDVIDEAIVACRLFVLVFSEPASLSQWVKGELNLAFTEKKIILPYRIDAAPLKGAMRLILNQMHWVEAYPDAESKFGELVSAAERFLGRPAESAAPVASVSSAASARTNAAAAPVVAAAGVSSAESVGPETPVGSIEPSAAPVSGAHAAARRYAVGDCCDVGGKRGIVFEVDETGCRGKMMGLKKSDERLSWSSEAQLTGAEDNFDGSLNQRAIERIAGWREKYPAFAWCAAQGEGWYLPSSEELSVIYRQRRQLAKACAAAGGDKDLEWVYWSSTEFSDRNSRAVDYMSGAVLSHGNDKSGTCYVRAVCAFSTSVPVARTDAAAPVVAAAAGRESEFAAGTPTEGPITAVPMSRARFGCWTVGDYYDVGGKRGIVFEVDASGQHGKIVALRDAGRPLKWQVRTDTLFVRTIADSCDDGAEALACVKKLNEWERTYPAFAYCSSLGGEWYLPTLEELRTMQELRSELSEACVERGGVAFTTGSYWSCDNYGRTAMAVVFATGYVFDNDKSTACDVRAVAAF